MVFGTLLCRDQIVNFTHNACMKYTAVGICNINTHSNVLVNCCSVWNSWRLIQRAFEPLNPAADAMERELPGDNNLECVVIYKNVKGSVNATPEQPGTFQETPDFHKRECNIHRIHEWSNETTQFTAHENQRSRSIPSSLESWENQVLSERFRKIYRWNNNK